MTPADHPGVICPPPLLYLAALIIFVALDQAWPMPILDHAFIRWSGGAILILGLALNLWGVWSMHKARTPINPYRSVTSIVATGAFRWTRNPLYVGLDLIYIGLTLLIDSVWGLLMLAPLLVVMHFGVVLREERYLAARFGEPYRQYCASVRRYL